jgi:hypothetical protein
MAHPEERLAALLAVRETDRLRRGHTDLGEGSGSVDDARDAQACPRPS